MKRPTLLVGLMTALLAASLLGAICVPRARAARQRATRVKAQSCLRQIGMAALLYANSQPPAASQPSGPSLGAAAAAPGASPATEPAANPAALWGVLRGGGQVVLVRHAATPPGSGEPANFDLADRSTQRNLSDAGREQAARLGAAFRREGVPVGKVLCSQYFRCRDTAALAFGFAIAEPLLNGLPEDAGRAKEQAAGLRGLVSERPGLGNTILVTHQGNIVALTGIRPEPGECVILTPEGDGVFRVVGRLKADVSGAAP